jgi:hypothetical protein
MLRERRGTCSTKHLFLARAFYECFPETEPEIVHRVYRLERELAGYLARASPRSCQPRGSSTCTAT